jgi:hypothetical protein
MNITVNRTTLRPTTIAAIIADLLDMPSGTSLTAVKALLNQLEVTVGEEESIDYLVDAGVTPDQVIEMWDLVAE